MNRKGFTLIELFIALTLATLIVYEVGALELSSRRTAEKIDIQADLSDELNIAFAHMHKRITNAVGYRAADDTHYGLKVESGGNRLTFYLDSNRNGKYDTGDSSYRYQYQALGGSISCQKVGNPLLTMVAENIIPNPDGAQVFEIVNTATAHNQVRVTLTTEKTADGEVYRSTLQSLITARGMVN